MSERIEQYRNSKKRLGVLSSCFALNSLLNSRIDPAEIEHRFLENDNVFMNFAKYLLENEEAWEKYEIIIILIIFSLRHSD